MSELTWRGVVDDAAEMLELRRQLAELELRQDRKSVIHFVCLAVPAIVLMITGFALLVWLALWNAANAGSWSVTTTFLVATIALIGVGLLIFWTAWRTLSRELCLLRDSIAELREDVQWLRSTAGMENAE